MVTDTQHLRFGVIRNQLRGGSVSIGHNRARNDSGFTLLEILVALAILGMSLSIILGVFSVALDRTRQAQQRLEAANLAQALLLRAETASPETLQDSAGSTPSGFTWRLHIEDYGTSDDHSNWPERVVRVATTVQWDDHGRTKSLTLATLRLLPKSGAS